MHVLLYQQVLISNHRSNHFQSWQRAKPAEAENPLNARDLPAWTPNQQEEENPYPSDNCKLTIIFNLIFNFSLADEIPQIIESMKNEGASDLEIRKRVLEMKEASIQNYGNRSKVGLEI